MDLDELRTLLETLRTRIGTHQTVLSQSEAQTRYSLIDPLLRQLGWDIEDPSQVRAEYKLNHSNQVVDYALFASDDQTKPRLVIEAKKLNSNLNAAAAQASNYCVIDAVKYFVVADGNNWTLYDTFKQVPLNEKTISEFSITDPSQNAAMRSLHLWRGNVATGHLETPPQRNVFDSGTEPPLFSAERPLAELEPSKESLPLQLIFPDGQTKRFDTWRQLRIRTLEWVVDTRKIDVNMCPIVSSTGASLINNKNISSRGKPFSRPCEYHGFWISMDATARAQINWVLALMRTLQIDLTTVLFKSAT